MNIKTAAVSLLIVALMATASMAQVVMPRKSLVRIHNGGSGVAVVYQDKVGIFTAYHVVGNNKSVYMTHNGTKYTINAVERDANNDLVMFIGPSLKKEECAELAASLPQKGDKTSFAGMSKGTFRVVPGVCKGVTNSKITVSGQARAGDSGGPIFDKDGRVVGILQRTYPHPGYRVGESQSYTTGVVASRLRTMFDSKLRRDATNKQSYAQIPDEPPVELVEPKPLRDKINNNIDKIRERITDPERESLLRDIRARIQALREDEAMLEPATTEPIEGVEPVTEPVEPVEPVEIVEPIQPDLGVLADEWFESKLLWLIGIVLVWLEAYFGTNGVLARAGSYLGGKSKSVLVTWANKNKAA